MKINNLHCCGSKGAAESWGGSQAAVGGGGGQGRGGGLG